MTKHAIHENFEGPDVEFEQLQNDVNKVMRSMGLNYSFERIGKALDFSAFMENMLRFDDSLTADASPATATNGGSNSLLTINELEDSYNTVKPQRTQQDLLSDVDKLV